MNILKLALMAVFAVSHAFAGDFDSIYAELNRDFQEEKKRSDVVDFSIVEKYEDAIVTEFESSQYLKSEFIYIKGKEIRSSQKHAISDLENYSRQRLGHHVIDQYINNNLSITVFSGIEENFAHFLNSDIRDLETVKKIPSIYENWGIKKFLAQGKKGQPKLYFVIPASFRYARHYATMLRSLDSKGKFSVLVDKRSFTVQRKMSNEAADRIRKQIMIEFDYLSFGYADVWERILNADVNWKLLAHKVARDEISGITADLLIIEHKKTNIEKKVLLLRSDKTVWGELASFMMSAFFHPKLEMAFFLGSAGAVSNANSVYDLSIPGKFKDQFGNVKINNSMVALVDKNETSGAGKVNFGAVHGNTFSPIEQTLPYLRALNKTYIDTVDVEQSLIAREITEYNKLNGTKLQMGVINLITDKPYLALDAEKSEFDLDRVDPKQKGQARIKAVSLILSGLSKKVMADSKKCESIF